MLVVEDAVLDLVPRRLERWRRQISPWLAAMSFVTCLAAATTPVFAAKWYSCPAPPFPTYPSTLGATNAPFVHPGHELTIVLNDDEVVATGGFSQEPGGNAIFVTFHSPCGTEVALPPRSATALGPAALAFDFPDTADEGYGLLAGPVQVRVFAGGALVALIEWRDLVALPPTNDVTYLVTGNETDEVAYAAVGASGDLWFPAHFQGDPVAMPMCPGDFIVPVSLQIGGYTLALDGTGKTQPLRQLTGLSAYFGDISVSEASLYGVLFMEEVRLVHIEDTLGVSLCKINDVADLVLRVKGTQYSGGGSKSLSGCAAEAAFRPVPLLLHGTRLRLESTDAFGSSCSTVAPASLKSYDQGDQGDDPAAPEE